MGLDALLSLADAVPHSDPNMALDGQNAGWVQPAASYSYELEEPRAYHHGMPRKLLDGFDSV